MLTGPRRRLLTASVAVLGTAALLAGCASAAPAATGSAVETEFGEVVIPEQIESVVVLEGRRDLDIVLALGLPLVGYPFEGPDTGIELPLPLEDELAVARENGAEQLFLAGEIDIEAIAAAEPSIIISRGEDVEPIYAELSAIAPILPVSTNDAGVTWQEDLRAIAELTGTENRAEEIIAEYDARLAEVKTTHAEALAAVPVAPIGYDLEGTEVEGGRLQSVILRDLGALPSSAFAEAGTDGSLEYSPEQTLEAFGDAGALLVFADTQEEWDAAQVDPLYAQLPAVVAGAVVRGDKMMHEGGPITAMHVLDLIDELYSNLG
ncbi:ABC transporter substrate-binding protein [Microbacterium sp. cx-55]|uniref:ABC transporter substrate-binding protein n=1 Tax=Microbacterium sp. cx-55 TaxID=2875948 RepID=UPI001CBAB0C4|nr:ABC transporter substrate-binding protein [Microbacterium sp. cx-55]MBZ4486733.1 ABC transporter substrate-binding protein [Microbacterium sp. cx-55]UGB36309.1 ABC transporter substrate-binding protein [Microbacterium sp. cx-55]